MTTETIIKAIDDHSKELEDLALKIWENPEMGWHEKKAAEWTAEVLRANGFEVEIGAYNMPTCVRAVWGEGKPVVGFAGEYDCLPGLSQDHCSYQKPIVEGGIGHGCGHNLLGAGCVGAVIGLKAAMEESGTKGTVIFYGCPAEEQMIGKGLMAKNGAFKECDFTMTWHPSTTNNDTDGTMTGVEGFIVEFFGKTSHAAGGPQFGRSALDAVQLMNMGVEFLREHVTDDVRIHYIIQDGGLAPNIVPDHAQSKFFVRSLNRENCLETYKRVLKCAEGAATMTETTYKITSLGGIYPTMQNPILCAAAQEARAELPNLEFNEEELKFADEINRNSGLYKEGTLPVTLDETLGHANGFGSTDYADVQAICPGFQVRTATSATLAGGHSWRITACSGSSMGMKGMIYAAKIMALASYKIMASPEKLQAAKDAFLKQTGGAEYVCPIGEDVEWPYKD